MSQDRTEKATPKRREDARRKGQIARGPELPAALGFLAALMVLRVTGGELLNHASKLFKGALARAVSPEPLTPASIHALLTDGVLALCALSLPIVAGALVASIAANFAQGGLTLTPGALSPRAERFNPAANFKRAFGGNNFVELIKSLLKLGGLGLVCYGALAGAIADAPATVGSPAPQLFASLGGLTYGLALKAGVVLALLAGLDYGYALYKHEKSLRMTKQELKDEYRQQEGDPMVKGQRRRAARALTQRRVAAEVPRADVVVMNPTHFAVALRYDRERDAAPVVVAKGADSLALRIRDIARRHNVAVVENPPLARALYRSVEAGRAISPELFRAVAELLAYVYRQREGIAGQRR